MKFTRKIIKIDKGKKIEVNDGFLFGIRKGDSKTLNYDSFDYSLDNDVSKVVNFYYYLRFKRGKDAADDFTHRIWKDNRSLETLAKKFSLSVQKLKYRDVEGRFIISLRIPERYLLDIKDDSQNSDGDGNYGEYKS